MSATKTPKSAIRETCRACVGQRAGDSLDEIRNCGGEIVFATGRPCPFFLFRLGVGRARLRVLRAFCIECMGGHITFVADCETTSCVLHSYRFGKNPARAGLGNPSTLPVSGRK